MESIGVHMIELGPNEDIINCARRDLLTRITLTLLKKHGGGAKVSIHKLKMKLSPWKCFLKSICYKYPIGPKHESIQLCGAEKEQQSLIFFQSHRISIVTVFYYTRDGRDDAEQELSVGFSLCTFPITWTLFQMALFFFVKTFGVNKAQTHRETWSEKANTGAS